MNQTPKWPARPSPQPTHAPKRAVQWLGLWLAAALAWTTVVGCKRADKTLQPRAKSKKAKRRSRPRPASVGALPPSHDLAKDPNAPEGNTPEVYPVKVTDDRGKIIVIPRKPRRIVVGGTALYTEILLDLGAKSRIVGVADSPNTPAAAKGLPSVGRPWPLNIEKVLSLRPDIVFCAMAKARQKLEQDAKATVFTGGGKGGYIHSVDGLFRLIQKIDRIIHGNDFRAGVLIRKIETGLQGLEQRVSAAAPVDVAIIYVPKPQSSRLYVIGKASSPGSALIKRAKGHNVFADQKGGLVGIEALLARDPEVLITDPKHIQRLYQHRALRSLKAIRNKRVVGIKASHYTSSRLLRVFRQLLKALHPTLTDTP